MHIHFGTELLHAEWPESVVCIGTFDGVHLGHQEVIRQAVRLARERDLPCVLVTFDRHPAAILAPDRCPPTIASIQQNLRHFEELGVGVAVVLPFDVELSETPAERFFSELLVGRIHASCIVVGHDFAFGKNRSGTTSWLEERVETHVVPPFEIGGARVSSSAIREALLAGRMQEAASLLGRPFEIPGIVVKGRQLGRTLEFPTVNLARSIRQILPPDGIYAGRAETPSGEYKAAVSIGFRPTVGGTARTVEAYLLDYPGHMIYGASIVLKLSARLRDERKFDTLEELKMQMGRDVEQVSRVI